MGDSPLMSNPEPFPRFRDPPSPRTQPLMLEQAYEPCQPNGRYDTDDYHDWLADIYATRLAHATDGGFAMAIARRINPLTGEPLGLVWDTFYGDVAS